jgi:hypothetical protein
LRLIVEQPLGTLGRKSELGFRYRSGMRRKSTGL